MTEVQITINTSMTADGKIVLPAENKLERIGNDFDLERLKRLRRQADAILVGSGTVIADNTALRVKKETLKPKNNYLFPLRICLIGTKFPDPASNIFKPGLGGTTLIFTGKQNVNAVKTEFAGIQVIPTGDKMRPDLPEVIKVLSEIGVRELLVEGGAHINGAFLQADLVDRYYLTVCPYLFNGEPDETLTPFAGSSVTGKNDRRMRLVRVDTEGDWVFLTYARKRI